MPSTRRWRVATKVSGVNEDHGLTDIHCEDPAERVAALVRLLDIRPSGDRRFIGVRKHGGVGRIYGGEVAAQALAAASRTVSGYRQAHSLHAYFLRGGDERHDIDYRVEADFDGGSFSNRRVIASQRGSVIFSLAASFHRREGRPLRQMRMDGIPPPDGLPTIAQTAEAAIRQGLNPEFVAFLERRRPIDMRPVTGLRPISDPDDPGAFSYWFRTTTPIGDVEPWMHRAILTYVSDFGLLMPARMRMPSAELQMASLDHSLWFHRDFRADEWLYYAIENPWAGMNRALGTAHIFNRDGDLVATVAQEGLMRHRAPT